MSRSLYDDGLYSIVHLNRSQRVLRDIAMHKLISVRSCFDYLLSFVVFFSFFVFFFFQFIVGISYCAIFFVEYALIFHPISRCIKNDV